MNDPRDSDPGAKRPGVVSRTIAKLDETTHKLRTGRVRHDERGNAVWDMAVATGVFALESTTRLLKKLDTSGLKLEEHGDSELRLEDDKKGGYDPYNRRR